MPFELLPVEHEARPEFWARVCFPLYFGVSACYSEAADLCGDLLLAPLGWTTVDGHPLSLLNGAGYVGHRADGAPLDRGNEELLEGDMTALLTPPANYDDATVGASPGKLEVAEWIADPASNLQALMIAAQIIQNHIAAGDFGTTDPVLTIAANDPPPGYTLTITCPGFSFNDIAVEVQSALRLL